MSAEEFAKSVTQTFGKKVYMCEFCNVQFTFISPYFIIIIFLFYLAGDGGESSMGFSRPKVSFDISQDLNLASIHISMCNVAQYFFDVRVLLVQTTSS